MDERKEFLTVQVGENESSKYWLSVLNELKTPGVKDILILWADRLTGIKESVAALDRVTEKRHQNIRILRNVGKPPWMRSAQFLNFQQQSGTSYIRPTL